MITWVDLPLQKEICIWSPPLLQSHFKTLVSFVFVFVPPSPSISFNSGPMAVASSEKWELSLKFESKHWTCICRAQFSRGTKKNIANMAHEPKIQLLQLNIIWNSSDVLCESLWDSNVSHSLCYPKLAKWDRISKLFFTTSHKQRQME